MEKTVITIKSFFNLLLELLFPSHCVGCNISGVILCSDCMSNLKRTERLTENNILAVYDYKDKVVKDIIWKLKYHNASRLGEQMGKLLYSTLLEDIADTKTFSQGSPIYVIPVPISNERKKNRGYNQSEIIAKSFCEEAGKNIFEFRKNIIFKKITTIPQAKLTNRNKRLQNIKGTFEIRECKEIKGKTIIIIDDVTTTGGTILEIMKLLKKAGAKKVLGFAVAH